MGRGTGSEGCGSVGAMNGGEFLMWLHLCAMASYVGAQFAVIYMLIPAAETAPNEACAAREPDRGLQVLQPVHDRRAGNYCD